MRSSRLELRWATNSGNLITELERRIQPFENFDGGSAGKKASSKTRLVILTLVTSCLLRDNVQTVCALTCLLVKLVLEAARAT